MLCGKLGSALDQKMKTNLSRVDDFPVTNRITDDGQYQLLITDDSVPLC